MILRTALVLSVGLAPLGEAQSRPRSGARPADAPTARYDASIYSSSAATSARFKALRWRNVGPFRGGRSVAVAGDPTKPLIFYFGAANGGVWKTSNAGQTWVNITDGKSDISSVGALAVAPSDPNVIYVGTGESQLREDLTYGTGMYRTTDGGQTWQQIGLGDSHQIAKIVVDPSNPDRALVAAIGHAFGPNAERGVFRTTDGGKSWQRVLFLNDSTGATDLSMDATNPRILYAAMWKFQRTPWGMDAGGGRSGLWKSVDGGDTWKELTFNPGIPAKPIGRIGVSVSPANPLKVYASIEAPDSSGGIFRSDDAGATWQLVSGDQKFAVRPFYYSAVTADPLDENTVYVMNLQVWRSIDGGKDWQMIRVPHGDTHIMWVDPKDSKRLINGNDGGGTVSLDGGATWSSQDNQPTAQFYHVTTDHQFPYRIYGAQQDNSTVSISSRSDDGRIGVRDFFPVAGCENAHIAIDPRKPNVTYGGCYTGMLNRYDSDSRQSRDIAIWLSNYDGWAVADVPYRFQWTFPVLLSPHDPNVLYAASQFVHRSTTEGASWEKISPDLTVHDPKTLVRSGGPIHGDMTGTEWYATIYALAESPIQKGLLWAGSDDGLIHIRRTEGGSWDNVTPSGFGKFTRTAVIEPSRYDAGTAYLAATRYQLDDFAPYLWKTTDYGKSWTPINAGIPLGAYTRSIREDPVRRGLLYAATEIGVFISFDDGNRWETLQLNLPRSAVRDLRVHGNDLIAATHGRSFWALDDISSLRQLGDSVTSRKAFLFQPATAMRWFGGSGASPTAGENPPNGAIIDYWLAEPAKNKVTLQFLDDRGTVLRTYTSEPPPADSTKTASDSIGAKVRAALVDSIAYRPADSVVTARRGSQRFVWDLRHQEAKQLKNTVVDMGTLYGPVAPPGKYQVRLIVAADTLARRFDIIADPRSTSSTADLVAQTQAVLRVRDRLNDVVDAARRIEDIQAQIDQRTGQGKDQPNAKRAIDDAASLRKKLEAIRSELYEVGCHADQCTLDQPIKLYNMLVTLNAQLQTGDYAPTKQLGEVYQELSGKVDEQLKLLRALEDAELKALNAALKDLGLPEIYLPRPKGIA